MRFMLNDTIHLLKRIYRRFQMDRLLSAYLKNGRKPWSEGYTLYKEDFIKSSLHDERLLRSFQENKPLPREYGKYLDERVVEYPWLLSRIANDECRVLDAGSTLNFDYILDPLKKKNCEITIATLEPEAVCFWKDRISYIYCDLRVIPFRDDWFDKVISVSVIEHIGMDNSTYSANPQYIEKNPVDFLRAVSEFRRVTKPGGKVYITVPYGRHIDYGWYQQFNADMIHNLIEVFGPSRMTETYYCYEDNGWSVCPEVHCMDCIGFDIHKTKYFNPESDMDYDPDFAASSRAIAALELWK
jgi:SAM-dependent methyltransferase